MNAPTIAHRPKRKVVQFPAPARRLLVPREHGSWGLWVLPLVTGAVVGAVHVHGFSVWPIVWLLIAAAFTFLAYQPLEELLGFSPYRIRSDFEKKIVAAWIVMCSVAGIVAAFELVKFDRGPVLWFAALGVASFAIRLILNRARRYRVARQILGALSLSSTSAAAYYAATRTWGGIPMLLWAAYWLFAIGQIEYVQLRVHTAAVQTRVEKIYASLGISLYHLVLLYFATIAATTRMVHPLFAIAFLPAVVRILVWAARKPARVNFHVLGFSELFQSVLFSSFLLAAFLQN